jgi:hypothetical protein
VVSPRGRAAPGARARRAADGHGREALVRRSGPGPCSSRGDERDPVVRFRDSEPLADHRDRIPPSVGAGARPGFERARALAPIRAAVYSLVAGCSRALYKLGRLAGEAGAQMLSASLAARVSRFGDLLQGFYAVASDVLSLSPTIPDNSRSMCPLACEMGGTRGRPESALRRPCFGRPWGALADPHHPPALDDAGKPGDPSM